MLTYRPLVGLEASAGSGKTFALSVHFVYLLLTDPSLRASEILALTFTKKAAKEMHQKIMHALFLLSHDKLESSLLEQKELFLDALSHYANESTGKIAHKSKGLYTRALTHKPSIMTLDAFFMSVLKKFCWYAGVPSDFEIDELLDRNKLYERFLAQLDDSQRQSLAHLCLQNQWYGIKDCQSFFEHLLQFSLQSPEILTQSTNVPPQSQWKPLFERLRLEIMQHNLSQRAESALQITNFSELVAKTWLHKDKLQDYQYFKKLPQNEQLQKVFEELKEHVALELNAAEHRTLTQICSLFGIFTQTLTQWQQQTHTLQIRDIALLTHRLLCGRKINMDFLYFRLDSKITHLLLDEFQDTSILQFQILEPLINEIVAGYSRKENRSFFYVGDIKQSIYHFRGSSPELFMHLADKKRIPRARLQNNWRSRAEIVAFVNTTFAPLYPHYTAQTAQKQGGFVRVRMHENAEILKQNVLACVQELLEQGIPPEEIAILGFHNKDLLHIQESLMAELPQIPIAKEANSKISAHAEVQALFAALCFYQSRMPIDERRFFALLGIRCDDSLQTLLATFETSESNAQWRPSVLLKSLMESYHLASPQAQKFLEISIPYRTIKHFLEWAQSDSASAAGQKHSEIIKGIRTLTIHGAKGLEFAHTIVIDSLSKDKPDSDKILFDYDIAHEHGQLFVREKYKEMFSPRYQEAQERKKKSNEEQALNLLYVACTRAKDSLNLLVLTNKSAFARLNLEESEHGEIVAMPQGTSHEPPQSIQIVQHDYGRQTRFLREYHSAHVENLFAAQLGNALHFALELALKFKLSRKSVESMLQQHYGYILPPQKIAEIVTKWEHFLKNKDFLEILSKGKLQCEVSFLKNNRVYRIDLLVVGDEEVVVVDYKSGHPDKEEYTRQIQGYKAIVAAYYRLPVRGYILTNLGLRRI